MRVGIGYDSHRLVEGRRLVIGGVDVPFEKGALSHSDGDVLSHAIIDALLGAMGKGDIGKFFPDTDPKWKDVSSMVLLKRIVEMVKTEGLNVLWIDSIVIVEKPKLSLFIDSMKDAISEAGVNRSYISIKAKTDEGMGFIGRGEGIAAHAVVCLSPNNPTDAYNYS
ncbi:MAG: 2-C-methyl-D-erythritol 2,4-cyclodiphosphate synthase [Nitrospirae bacterium]|nr:2-C-methyl-D-erythritol 2,4-cyclodiphosphate synthase [Nitrospirota bacterium]